MNVSTTPVEVPVGKDKVPLIQNLGPEPVYVARNAANILTSGIELLEGDALELVAPVFEGGGPVFVATSSGTSDVRVLSVG
jgi:hypothetical protein